MKLEQVRCPRVANFAASFSICCENFASVFKRFDRTKIYGNLWTLQSRCKRDPAMATKRPDYERMIEIWKRLSADEKARFLREADDHLGIPRDSSGLPIFFILPPGVQASYDQKMKQCERGRQATRDPLAFAEALTRACLHRQPPPEWVHEAGWVLATKRRGKEHAKRAREAAVRLQRYLAVRDAHKRDGLSWERAKDRAAEVLASTSAAAEPDTMWKVYKQVNKDLKSGRGGLYFMPQMPSWMRQGKQKIAWGELNATEAADSSLEAQRKT